MLPNSALNEYRVRTGVFLGLLLLPQGSPLFFLLKLGGTSRINDLKINPQKLWVIYDPSKSKSTVSSSEKKYSQN